MTTSESKQNRGSKTAELAAAARAHHLRTASPPVLRDDLAHLMCGPFWRTVVSSRILSHLVLNLMLKKIRPMIPIISIRARFAEDCIESELATHDRRQLVIVGAGYDTLALRRQDLADKLEIYELDLPATLNVKLERMRAAGLEKPDNLHQVACDLTKETMFAALDRAGFEREMPATFSWFGVSFYLEESAVLDVLSDIATTASPGSSVIFDYFASRAWTPAEFHDLREACKDFVAKRGEPWISAFNPPDIPEMLKELGYSDIDNVEPDRIPERHPTDYANLGFGPLFGLCQARLPAEVA